MNSWDAGSQMIYEVKVLKTDKLCVSEVSESRYGWKRKESFEVDVYSPSKLGECSQTTLLVSTTI
jgi:hypothetical protein